MSNGRWGEPGRALPGLSRPIVKPGSPWWAPALASPNTFSGAALAGAGVSAIAILLVVGGAVMLAFPAPAPFLGLAILAALLVGGVLGNRAASGMVVRPENPMVGGVALRGHGLELLADIQARFDYAQRLVGEIPTGIAWSEISDNVAVLLWDAAQHAGRVSALDGEIFELRYAAPGTPQAAYKDSLQQRRTEHEQAMVATQWEAEDLARHAGNAAAAARLALARTGDRALLEVVAPSGRVLLARDALGQVKERLAMLSDVWSELDVGGAALAEKIRYDAEDEPRA